MPPSGPLLIVLFGFLLLRTNNYRKTGKTVTVSGFLLLYLLSTGLVANVLIRPLEDSYPPLMDKVKADAIVVLTAGVRDLSHIGMTPYPDSSSLERLIYGYQIHRSLDGVPIIISGGKADPSKSDVSIGAALGKVALEIGVPEKDLIVEDESLNTFEGALQVKEMLKGRGDKVILVTSASHMARSVKLYKKVGFDVTPAPTDFMGGPIFSSIYSFIPSAGSLGISATALYEYLSTLWYVLKGTF